MLSVRILLLSLLALSLSAQAQIKLEEGVPSVQADRILLEANDAGEEISIPRDEMDLLLPSGYFDFKKSFNQVARVITPQVESAFDVFIIANVAYEKYYTPGDYIPAQRMRVFRKAYAGQQVFRRDAAGNILAHDPVYGDVLGTSDAQPALPGFPGLIKISSGASHFGSGYVDTFSGVFRLNHSKSLSNPFSDGMFNSLYVDILYPSGRASGIAVHGTNQSRYGALGSQASHGCIRVHQAISKPLYKYVLSEGMYQTNLLDFDRYNRLPNGPLRDTRPGYRVLMVFFYGYDGVAL